MFCTALFLFIVISFVLGLIEVVSIASLEEVAALNLLTAVIKAFFG